MIKTQTVIIFFVSLILFTSGFYSGAMLATWHHNKSAKTKPIALPKKQLYFCRADTQFVNSEKGIYFKLKHQVEYKYYGEAWKKTEKK